MSWFVWTLCEIQFRVEYTITRMRIAPLPRNKIILNKVYKKDTVKLTLNGARYMFLQHYRARPGLGDLSSGHCF